jgi:hypothetical protein
MATEGSKKRICLKCRQEKLREHFAETPSPFFPGHLSLICNECLCAGVDAKDWNAVDRMLRWLDLPFEIDKWTKLHKVHGKDTLIAYLNLMKDKQYETISWKDANERWALALQEEEIDEQIDELREQKYATLIKKWGDSYNKEELIFLDELYAQICSTQNVSTPILQQYAKDFCEITLRITKKIRIGEDAKKDMDARDNIVKVAKFEASNSKTAANFESVGELMVYYAKKGWRPNWHQEPQDSIDFLMGNIQQYLTRLVNGEGGLAEQVSSRKESYNLSQRLEESDDTYNEDYDTPVEYEDGEALEEELDNDWEV